MMVIDNKFEIGQIVYLKTDKEQLPRIVTAFLITSSTVIYKLNQGTAEDSHYDIEISETKDVLITSNN